MNSNHKIWIIKGMVVFFIVIVAVLSVVSLALADDRAKLIGIWKLVSFDAELQDTGESKPIFGNNPQGYLIFTSEGRMMTLFTGEGRKVPKTTEEQSSAWSSMYAYSGMYRIEGDKVTIKIDVSWNEAWTGTELIRFYKLEGDRLKVISAWSPSTNPNFHLGRNVRAILTWERVK